MVGDEYVRVGVVSPTVIRTGWVTWTGDSSGAASPDEVQSHARNRAVRPTLADTRPFGSDLCVLMSTCPGRGEPWLRRGALTGALR